MVLPFESFLPPECQSLHTSSPEASQTRDTDFCASAVVVYHGCLRVGGRGAPPPTAIHQRLPNRSLLTPAAIMPHQVGQLPSLAAEQRAQAGAKIKYAAAALRSLELSGLMLY